jgi:V/A-type H+-transporting ATPase subunit A
MKTQATGKVVKAFGNLLHVMFEGSVRQGEVCMVDLGGVSLKAEVIEIVGNEVKLQVESSWELMWNFPLISWKQS